ncbi:MAG: outer membrane beta-barrel protein [Candidatus Palauibacterales bacterium]|nr:outer membrane beta-barrel protein [Candidatus Palauibacterales bacterium]MDP2529222.1 outer membrane beta-barrel protein [Candidatus Palauibacterales bacterium]
MNMRTKFGIGVLAALLAGAPAMARAQDARWSIDPRGGLTLPIGNLKNIEKPGFAAGIGIAYWVMPRVAVRADVAADVMSSKDQTHAGILVNDVPDVSLYSYTGGVEFRLTPPDQERWDVTVNVGAGATTLDTNSATAFETASGGLQTDFTKTYFSGVGLVKFGYKASDMVDLYLSGGARLVKTKKADTGVFSAFSSNLPSAGFGSVVTFPIQLGVRASF